MIRRQRNAGTGFWRQTLLKNSSGAKTALPFATIR
jgi:hypothetical protein